MLKTNDISKLPLSGVRIIEWAIKAAGPAATKFLADMGAEVIKVEIPAGGDPNRDSGSMFNLPHGVPYNFENFNRNKKSIAVDLTKEEGKQIIYSLVATVD
ncbi:CoA transferase, partial [Thermodesulfobacteriota bacterium]